MVCVRIGIIGGVIWKRTQIRWKRSYLIFSSRAKETSEDGATELKLTNFPLELAQALGSQ